MATGFTRLVGCSAATARVVKMPQDMYTLSRRWASKKSGGSTKNGRDSESKRLGVKKFGGQSVVAGNIILRQRGTKYHVGTGVGLGKDHTIFATRDGFVRFWYNVPKKRQEVSVKAFREVQRVKARVSA